MKNNGGGITSLNLENQNLIKSHPTIDSRRNIPIHGKVVVNSMCCEMKHEE